MKKMLLMTMIVMGLSFAMVAEAADVTVDATFATKHLWHGIDMYDDVAALSAAINIDLNDGFYAGVKYTMPGSGGNAYDAYSRSDATQWDYWVGYKNQAMVGEMLQADYDLSYTYYDWGTIRRNSLKLASGADLDVQELALDIKFPNLCPMGMFVPRYNIAYMFKPGGGDGNVIGGDNTGFIHTVGAGYDFVVADMPMKAGLDFVYDDAAITGKHDWTRAVLGLSTEFNVGNGKLVPGVYYQHAFLDGPSGVAGSPALDDDLYATLTYSMKF